MAECIVKYKLEKQGAGYVVPDVIYDGGHVWSSNGHVADMILVGKTMSKVTKNEKPDCVIEKITKKQWDAHYKSMTSDKLIEYKSTQYSKLSDALFIEALRKRELGDDTKWKAYLKLCKSIKNIKTIPQN